MKDKSNYVSVTYRFPEETVLKIDLIAEKTGLTKCAIVINALTKLFEKKNVNIKQKLSDIEKEHAVPVSYRLPPLLAEKLNQFSKDNKIHKSSVVLFSVNEYISVYKKEE